MGLQSMVCSCLCAYADMNRGPHVLPTHVVGNVAIHIQIYKLRLPVYQATHVCKKHQVMCAVFNFSHGGQ